MRAPEFRLVVDGRDISATVEPRLIELTLTEGREDNVDTLELRLSDHDGRLALPQSNAVIALALGWAGAPLVDKGTFKVDEVEHTGTPDAVCIRARSADLTDDSRRRTEKSWHDTTVGTIVADIAKRLKLAPRVDATLGSKRVQHIDQTESDMAFISRLAKRYDAVATVKKGRLLFLPINRTTTSDGKPLQPAHITRAAGDQHRYHMAERDSYTGVRAYWVDPRAAKRKSVLAGTKSREKRLRDTFATEADAMAAAKAELQRLERGKATFELTLALGRPDITPQAPVTVAGFKQQIDGTDWLVKTATHTLGDGGFTTKLEMERGGGADAQAVAE